MFDPDIFGPMVFAMPDPNSTIRRIYIVDDIVSLIVLKNLFLSFINFFVDSSFISH